MSAVPAAKMAMPLDARGLDQAGVAGEFDGAAFDGECVGRDDARGDAIADVVDGGGAVEGLDGDAASTRCFNPAGVGYGGVGCRVDGKTVRTIRLNQTAGQIVDVERARIGLDRESIVEVRNNRAGVFDRAIAEDFDRANCVCASHENRLRVIQIQDARLDSVGGAPCDAVHYYRVRIDDTNVAAGDSAMNGLDDATVVQRHIGAGVDGGAANTRCCDGAGIGDVNGAVGF